MYRAVHILLLLAFAGQVCAQQRHEITIAPATMPKIAKVDNRFLSYNIEMVEVTGGRFWKPYSADVNARLTPEIVAPRDPNQQVGMDPNLFQYRPPIDLSNARLRNLAKAIGPVYLRVSGSWANNTYFQDDDSPALKQAPAGFNGVLTRAQWKGVIDFARAIGADLVTSFAISTGTRDANGVWIPAQAKALLNYTKALGSGIAAAEFMNEPALASNTGAPKGYDAAAFARDAKIFHAFLRKESPKTIFLGPGNTGDVSFRTGATGKIRIPSEDILKATGPIFDALSYHFYGAVSRRCAARLGGGITVDRALSAEWLDRTDKVESFYARLRDRYLPGKPLWVTETAEAACGGDQFAGEFADSFRFLNQLGTLSSKGVKTVMHNTLAASDYGLLNGETLEPRPNYWAAVLWNRMMGTTVLDPGKQNSSTVRIYAHCMKQRHGGVAILALNTDDKEGRTVAVPIRGERYTFTAPDLTAVTVLLNGSELKTKPDGSLPAIKGQSFPAGSLRLPARSITFLAMPSANNESCR